MTSYVVFSNANVTTVGPAYSLTSADQLLVARGATLVHSGAASTSSTAYAVSASGGADINIAGGLVSTKGSAIGVGTNGGFITVAQEAQLYAFYYGIRINDGSAVIVNNGEIAGSSSIYVAGGVTGTTNYITNNGLLSSGVVVTSNSTTLFTNTGRVTTVMTQDFLNSAAYNAASGGNGVDVINNSGVITGGVYLGGGNDYFSGRGGQVIGVVSGGLGDDSLTGGDFSDVLWGDDTPASSSSITSGGADTLVGGLGDDVIYGGYGADALYGNQDNDVLYGNQDNDWMHGGQGDDILYGGQGNDTLNGGKGDDVLYGNLGDDRFEFTGRGFGHDRIADFRASGANDIIAFTTDIFGDFAAVQAGATTVSNGTLLTAPGGDTLLLVGIFPGSLTGAMFQFTG